MTHGVKLAKNTRKKLKWTKYRMSVRMGISQSQYSYIETKARSVKTPLLVTMIDIATREAGFTLHECFEMLREDAVAVEGAKRKRREE